MARTFTLSALGAVIALGARAARERLAGSPSAAAAAGEPPAGGNVIPLPTRVRRPGERAGGVDLTREAPFAIGPMLVLPSLCEVETRGWAVRIEPAEMQILIALARADEAHVGRQALGDVCRAAGEPGPDLQEALAKVRRLGHASGAFRIDALPAVGWRLTPAPPPQPSALSGLPAARR